MNRSNLDFLDQMFPMHDYQKLELIIVNQTTPKNKITSNFSTIKVINSFEKGLSKSRNLAIKHCITKFGLIADDDLVYQKNFEVKINQAISTYENYGLIVFQLENERHQAFKKYVSHNHKIKTRKQIQNISSAEMLLNTELLKEEGLAFDTQFGINAVFPMGEEQVFAHQLINKGIKIQRINLTIAQHHGKSSGQNPSSDAFFKTALALRLPYLKDFIYLWMLKYLFFLWRKNYIQFSEVGITFKRMKQQLNFVKKHLRK